MIPVLSNLMLCALLVPAGAAPPTSAEARRGSDDSAQVERLEAWPELADGAAAKREIARLRKAQTEEMGKDAAAQIRLEGAAYAPLLLDALGKERDADSRARITAALDSITVAAHTRLLALEWAHANEHVQAYALERVASFPDAGLVERARALYVALLARAEDPKAKDKPDEEQLDRAAITALSTGALEGLPRCLALAERDWKRSGERLRTAAAGAKGPAADVLLEAALTGASSDNARVATLLILGVAGTNECVSVVRQFLDSEANSVRVATINALRGIVDSAPPLENISVFMAIEEVKRWKERT